MISTTATRIALRKGGCHRKFLAASVDSTTAAASAASASPLSTPATSPSPAATFVGSGTFFFANTQQLRGFSTLDASLSMSSIAGNGFRTSSVSRRQWFSTTGGGDGDDDDSNNKPNGEGDESPSIDDSNDADVSAVTAETPESSAPPPPAATTIDDENYTTPAGVMSTFEDTSYYHPIELPAELSATYAHMSNEELQDSSTIPGWDMLIHSPPTRGTLPKGALVGKVVSTKMMKTINVAVDRYKTHTKYKKRLRYTRKFMAHDEREVAKDGDTVLIVPCQRLSKHKHFMLNQIITPKGQL